MRIDCFKNQIVVVVVRTSNPLKLLHKQPIFAFFSLFIVNGDEGFLRFAHKGDVLVSVQQPDVAFIKCGPRDPSGLPFSNLVKN